MESIDNISVGRIKERDIDLLLAEEFSVSPDFAMWFLIQSKSFSEVEAKVDAVYVSKSDSTGESDLVVIYKRAKDGKTFALMIEDKIDAPLQPEQLERYRLRAANEIARTESSYSEADVIICAPLAYKQNLKASNFDSFVSYEDIAAFFRDQKPTSARSEYRAKFVESASVKKINSSKPIYNAVTDNFWTVVYKIATDEFPDLEMKQSRYAAGTTWVIFRPHDMPTMPKHMRIDLKGASGYVDLTFPHTICRDMHPLVKPILEEGMEVHQTGKAAAIRLTVKPFVVCENFDDAKDSVRQALSASSRLVRFYLTNRAALDQAALSATPLD